jgi:hypothetical protein
MRRLRKIYYQKHAPSLPSILSGFLECFAIAGCGVTFSQYFSAYRWQHDVGRSYHVTGPRDHNIVLFVNNIINNIILYASCQTRANSQIADS